MMTWRDAGYPRDGCAGRCLLAHIHDTQPQPGMNFRFSFRPLLLVTSSFLDPYSSANAIVVKDTSLSVSQEPLNAAHLHRVMNPPSRGRATGALALSYTSSKFPHAFSLRRNAVQYYCCACGMPQAAGHPARVQPWFASLLAAAVCSSHVDAHCSDPIHVSRFDNHAAMPAA